MEGRRPLTLSKSEMKSGFGSHNHLSGTGHSSVNINQGTESFILVTLLVGLLAVSLLTTGASFYLVAKFNLFPGPALISFDEDGYLIFRQSVDMDWVRLTHNTVSGVESISGDVVFETPASSVTVNNEKVEFISPNGFQVTSPETGDKIFPGNLSSLSLPSSLSSLAVTAGIKDVKRIRSPVDSDLDIRGGSVKLRGNLGFHAEGRTVSLLAAKDIITSSFNGSVVLDAHEGIYLKGLKRSPGGQTGEDSQYKLCVCGKSGRIFRLHAKTPDTTCADVRFPESANPCV